MGGPPEVGGPCAFAHFCTFLRPLLLQCLCPSGYKPLVSFSTNQKQCCSRAEDRAFSRTCRLRGQGRGTEWGGAGDTTTPGPMDFKGPTGFRKAVGFSGPSRGPMSSRGGPFKWHWEISMWRLKTFFFWKSPNFDQKKLFEFRWRPFLFFFCFRDHLILTGKTVKISVETFFFGNNIIFWTKLQHFFRLFWTSQNRKSFIFELAPGRFLVPSGTGPRTSKCVLEESTSAHGFNQNISLDKGDHNDFETSSITTTIKCKKVE